MNKLDKIIAELPTLDENNISQIYNEFREEQSKYNLDLNQFPNYIVKKIVNNIFNSNSDFRFLNNEELNSRSKKFNLIPNGSFGFSVNSKKDQVRYYNHRDSSSKGSLDSLVVYDNNLLLVKTGSGNLKGFDINKYLSLGSNFRKEDENCDILIFLPKDSTNLNRFEHDNVHVYQLPFSKLELKSLTSNYLN